MKFDQVIIGASSSGLMAAKLLSEAGQRVAVFEQQPELNPQRRTYIITTQLEPVLGFIPKTALLHTVNTIDVATPEAEVSIRLQEPDLIIERNRLVRLLLPLAEQSGARMFFGYRFLGFSHDAGVPTLCFLTHQNEKIHVQADAVIGADGVFSTVGESSGIEPPPYVPIVQAEVDLPTGWKPWVTKVWFDVRDTRYFYWLIPESEHKAVVGLVSERAGETRKLLSRFLTQHHLKATAYQGGKVAMHHPRLRPWASINGLPIMLIGDAAGQVKVTTVGGTVTGFWGAQAVVKTILEGTTYQKNLRPLKRELDLHWYMRAMLERLDNAGYTQLIKSITPAVQSFLGKKNRDQVANAYWKLPFIEPRLLLVGIRCLLGSSNGKEKEQPYPMVIPD